MIEKHDWRMSDRGRCECGESIVERDAIVTDAGQEIAVIEERCTTCPYRVFVAKDVNDGGAFQQLTGQPGLS